MKKRYRYSLLPGALAVLLAGAFFALRSDSVVIDSYTDAGRPPAIHPDYVDTVIPPNIAPLNFVVDEPGTYYCVAIRAAQGGDIEVFSKNPQIRIPIGPWKELLRANRGGEVYFDVHVRAPSGQWSRFERLANRIAPEEIDSHLVYRMIKVTNLYRRMDLYQRNVEDYDESLILDNRWFGDRCFNCHNFLNNRPDTMVLQVRETPGPTPVGMLLARNGDVHNVDVRAGPKARPGAYTSWHPSGRMVAFSTNKFSMYTHSSGFLREVYDAGSVLGVYAVDSNTVSSSPGIASPDHSETFPCFSPDGKYLYFCSTRTRPLKDYKDVRYDLMRISYDAGSDTWGELETVLSSEETGLSISLPRISPDGRFLVCCMSQFGNFAIYQQSSDLYLIDLETGQCRPMEINSDRCESWHAWSSNSRWLVFSSKRIDNLFSRPYFSYIDDQGRAHKPVLLPQKDPAFYDSFLKTYNIPELVTGPVPIKGKELVAAIYSRDKALRAAIDASARPHGAPGAAEPDSWRAGPQEPEAEYP